MNTRSSVEFLCNSVCSEIGDLMGQTLTACDSILATHRAFLLGSWLADAHQWAASSAELPLYELNARMQLTLWAPDYVSVFLDVCFLFCRQNAIVCC